MQTGNRPLYLTETELDHIKFNIMALMIATRRVVKFVACILVAIFLCLLFILNDTDLLSSGELTDSQIIESTPQAHSTPPLIGPSCQTTAPDRIKSWIGNGLVTTVNPPVKANCQQLKARNRTEQEIVLDKLKNWTNSETIDEFYTKAKNCSYVRDLLSSDNFYVSDTEKNFPLAYVIMFHNSPQQIMRQLTVLYRPHNVYCLHPDGKADKNLIQVFRKLASCFDNIVIPDSLVKVTWGHISMVDAQLKCLRYLTYNYQHVQWKYANILCGKELPFNSNRVMVDTLSKLNGDSVVNAHRLTDTNFLLRFGLHFLSLNGALYPVAPRWRRVPFGIKLYKSYNYISASRKFVEFLLTSPRVRALHRYMSTALEPDEEFFATAYMLPEAPKTRTVDEVQFVKTFFAPEFPLNLKCTGKRVHHVCILNIRDLPLLHEYKRGKSTIFFYNKYFLEYDHVVMDCMEQRIVEQNKLEYKRDCN